MNVIRLEHQKRNDPIPSPRNWNQDVNPKQILLIPDIFISLSLHSLGKTLLNFSNWKLNGPSAELLLQTIITERIYSVS